MKRFFKEYINYKRNEIKENPLMKEQYKDEKLSKIDRVDLCARRGLISIDEGIKILSGI